MTTSTAAASEKMNAASKAAWTAYVDGQYEKLAAQLEEADAATIKLFALEGVASRLDNKYGKAALKMAAVAAAVDLTLSDIAPTVQRGQKAALLEEAFNLCQTSPASKGLLFAAMASGKVAELKAAIADATALASKAESRSK